MHNHNLNTDYLSPQAMQLASMPCSCFSCLVTQLCPTLCNPTDCSLSGFSVYGISQARILERNKLKLLSRVQFFVTPWTVAYQAPPSMGFSRLEYWKGFPFPSLGYLPYSGIEPRSLTLQVDSSLCEPLGKPLNRRKPSSNGKEEENGVGGMASPEKVQQGFI